MTAAADAAEELRRVLDEALEFADTCTAPQWESVTSEEGWTVAATLHHIALGNEQMASWIEAIRAGDPIEVTMDDLNADNARHAAEFAHADRPQTVELLRSRGDDLVALVASLGDEDLARSAPFGPAGGRPLNTRQALGAAVAHVRAHLDNAQAAAGAV